MLRGIHKASANWLGRAIMGVVLGLIAVSFGIWGIGDIFRGFGQSTVAKIGSTEIRIEPFRQIWMDRMQQIARQAGRPILPDQARALGLDRRVLAELISENLLDERARTLRLGISDDEVARRITEDPAFQGLTGQFDRARFDNMLRSVGLSEARYLADQRRQALRRQLASTVSGDIAVPKTALDAYNRFRNEERSIEYVVLDRSQAGEVPDPAPDVLEKYFEQRKVAFRAPEYRTVQWLAITPAEIAPSVEVSDADIKSAYEQRKARYQTPERRQIQQISFPNLDEARTAAEKIAKGTTFDAIAAERGLKPTDIDLGLLSKTAMVDGAVADAAFSLDVGKVSAPIEGRFGAVLVRVQSIEPAVTRSLSEVADEIRKELANERAKNMLAGIHDKIEDERLSGVSLPDIAKKFGYKLQTINAVDRTGHTPDGKTVSDLPQGVDLIASAFASDLHGDNDPLSIRAGGGYVWYDVTDIKPAHDQALDQIRDKVIARWRDDEIAARLKTKSAELLDKLKSGAALKDVADAANLKVELANGVKRDKLPADLPARAGEQMFRLGKGEAGVADAINGIDRVVYRIVDVTEPKFDPASEEMKRADEVLSRAIAEEVLEQYIAQLEKDIGVTINQSAVNQVVGGNVN